MTSLTHKGLDYEIGNIDHANKELSVTHKKSGLKKNIKLSPTLYDWFSKETATKKAAIEKAESKGMSEEFKKHRKAIIAKIKATFKAKKARSRSGSRKGKAKAKGGPTRSRSRSGSGSRKKAKAKKA